MTTRKSIFSFILQEIVIPIERGLPNKRILLQREPIKWQQYLLLGLIIIAGTFLRFHFLRGYSFSNDELSALYRAHYRSFKDLINFGIKQDGHPAGVQLFLYYWIQLFGNNVIAVRLPFAIFGCLSIPLAFAWCRLWFGNRAALFTAAGVAFLQFPVFYSQLARPYAPGLFMSMAMLWAWTELVFGVVSNDNAQKNYRLRFGFFVVTAALCCYIHYFSALFAFILGVTGIFELRGKERLRFILAGLLIFLLFIPHIFITAAQMKLGGLGWLGPPEPRFLTDYIFNIFNRSWILLGLSLGVGVLFFVLKWRLLRYARNDKSEQAEPYRIFTHFHFLALWLFLAPFLVGYIYSHIGKPVLQDSSLFFTFPLLPALIFSFANGVRSRFLFPAMLILFTSAAIWSLTFEKEYYRIEHYGQFLPLAQQVIEWDNHYGEQNIEHLIDLNRPFYIQYYFNKWQIKKQFDLYRCDDPPGIDSLFQIVKSSGKPYLSYGWSNVGNPEIVDDIIRMRYKAVEEKPHVNSRITLYRLENPWPVPLESYAKNDTAALFTTFKPKWNNALLNISVSLKVSADKHNPIPERDRPDFNQSGLFLVAAVKNKSTFKFWTAADLCDYFPAPVEDRKLSWQVKLPDIKSESGDSLQIYIWNPENIPHKARDFEVEFFK